MTDEFVRDAEGDGDFSEEWSRVTDLEDVLGISAGFWADEGSWQVWVSVLEFVREDPLESEFRAALQRALRAVSGVTSAEEEDRETYVVEGQVSGEALVRAGAAVIDAFEDRLRADYDDPT